MIQVLDLYACLSTTWAAKIEWERLGRIQRELPENFNEVEGEDDVESEALDEKRKAKQSTKFCLGTKKMKEEISENLLWYHLKQSKREREIEENWIYSVIEENEK